MKSSSAPSPSPLAAERLGVSVPCFDGQQAVAVAVERPASAEFVVPLAARDAAPSYCAWPATLVMR